MCHYAILAFAAVPASALSRGNTAHPRNRLAPCRPRAPRWRRSAPLSARPRIRTMCAAPDPGTARAADANADPAAAPRAELPLQRRDLERDTRHGRVARYEMEATASALDVDAVSGDARISVVAQPVRAHFRVRGAVSASVSLECDRCLSTFAHPARGSFEVWLSASGAAHVQGLSDAEFSALEAVEDFRGTDATVDLAPHARDAILLAHPSKALCTPDCPGIAIADRSMGTVTHARDAILLAHPSKALCTPDCPGIAIADRSMGTVTYAGAARDDGDKPRYGASSVFGADVSKRLQMLKEKLEK